MIIVLGETAAAEEIGKKLLRKKIPFKRIKMWPLPEGLHKPAAVLDAIHPSRNTYAPISQWCETNHIPYLRLERPETKVPDSPLVHPVYTWEEAMLTLAQRVEFLSQKKGASATVFVTTGSFQLESIVQAMARHKARLIVRILPEGRLVQKCQDLGVSSKDIVAMQGPFSKEINKALFKFYGIDLLLTRDSGRMGGTDTKIAAALQMEIETVLIKKTPTSLPQTVSSIKEMLVWVECLKSSGNELG